MMKNVNTQHCRLHHKSSHTLTGVWQSLCNHETAYTWLTCILMTVFAGIIRFVRLGSPNTLVFDETYYVKDAWTMLMTGEARNWPTQVGVTKTSIDQLFADGQTNLWLPSAEYVVHPPIGKWCIAVGLELFGGANNPFAWRFATAFAGTIAVLLVCRAAFRLFHDRSIALIAGFLMTIDGLGITMSRTSLLDNFIMVFVLAAFCCLLAHRDWALSRLRLAFTQDMNNSSNYTLNDSSFTLHKQRHNRHPHIAPHGPFIAFSWWRLAAAILLGLATATKWSGAYFFAIFALTSVIWDAYARHQVGYRSWLLSALTLDGSLTAIYMIPTWVATYLASWTGWFMHHDSYMHQWGTQHPNAYLNWAPVTLQSFVQYHKNMWNFHVSLDSPHPYSANPLTWPMQIRPTSFYWEKLPKHTGLCKIAPYDDCVSSITSLGNPLIWWLASICLFLGLVICLFVQRGDWRFSAVLLGLLAGWLPWMQYLHRTTFTFYSIVFLPWMVLIICYIAFWLKHYLTPSMYHRTCKITIITLGLASVFFYPIWTALPIPYNFWIAHMWLPSWI